MKRIAFIIDEAISGISGEARLDGLGRIKMPELAKAITALGYRVDIYAETKDPGLPELIRYTSKVQLILLEPSKDPAVFSDRMLQVMIKNQWVYELIQVNSFPSALIASRLKKILPLPYVVDFDEQELSSIEKDKVRWLIRDADHLITASPQRRKEMIRIHLADPKRISSIPMENTGKKGRELISVYEKVDVCQRVVRYSQTVDPGILQQQGVEILPQLSRIHLWRHLTPRLAYFLTIIIKIVRL